MAKAKKNKEEVSSEHLKAQILELDREIFVMRNELSINRKLEKPHLLKAKKREKARALTLLTLAQKNREVKTEKGA